MKERKLITDEQLVERIKKGDDKSFEVLFKRYYTDLCNYVFGLVGDEEAAKDLVNECLVKIWDIRQYIRIEKTFRVYIFSFVHKRSLNYLRHRNIQLKHVQEEQERNTFETNFDSADNPLQLLELTELKERISIAINSLPDKCGEIFKLSRFENMSYNEIAEQLNISITTVRTQMSRALEKLRVVLNSNR